MISLRTEDLPLEKFAKLMGKSKEDLLKDNSIKEQIRYWGGFIGPVLGAVTASLIGLVITWFFVWSN